MNKNEDHDCQDCKRFVHSGGESVVLCPTCRRRLRVGELVEGMPDGSTLLFVGGMWCFDPAIMVIGSSYTKWGTPLEALEKRGGYE